MLIKFDSPQGTPIYIESRKISGVREIDDKTTYIFVQAGNENEDWIVGENVAQVIQKIPSA